MHILVPHPHQAAYAAKLSRMPGSIVIFIRHTQLRLFH